MDTDPIDTDPRSVVITARGCGTVADVLAERHCLPAAECRGIAVAVLRTLARRHRDGVVHGDVKPSNLVISPAGGLWVIDVDAAGPTLDPADDVRAVGVTAIECATGVLIDGTTDWSFGALAALGCPGDLAADIVHLLDGRPTAHAGLERLAVAPHRLPAPAARIRHTDPTPTIEVAPTHLPGLEPVGTAEPASAQWSSRTRSSSVSRRTTRRASPPDTNTTGGRGTLL